MVNIPRCQKDGWSKAGPSLGLPLDAVGRLMCSNGPESYANGSFNSWWVHPSQTGEKGPDEKQPTGPPGGAGG